MDRPGVVLAQLAREILVAKLGSRLVDAGEEKLASPLGLGAVSRWRRQNGGGADRMHNQTGDPHGEMLRQNINCI